MQYVLIGFAAACLAAVVVLALKLASALRDVNAAGDLFRAQCAVTDGVAKERDQLAVANATLTAQNATANKALSDAEARIAVLAQKVVKLTTKNLETAPLEEGAAAVNLLFSKPLIAPKDPK